MRLQRPVREAFVAFVGVDQAFAIEGVAAHHATDGVASIVQK